MIVALPAVAELEKNVVPFGVFTVAPLLLIVALPADELSMNRVLPARKPTPAVVPPLFVMTVIVPAVALFVKRRSPLWPAAFTAVTKFCVMPEVFVMPAPVIVSVKPGAAVIV